MSSVDEVIEPKDCAVDAPFVDALVEDAVVDEAVVDDAGVEGNLFDRPSNKRGAGVRDGLAAAGAEGGLDTIFGLFILFWIYYILIFFDDDDRSL